MIGVAAALAVPRLVVKVGSALLVAADGTLRRDWLDTLSTDLARFAERGQSLIVVSSGAIALGRRKLGLTRASLRLEEKQAAAAAGQIELARGWQESMGKEGLETAQVLVTLDDTEARRRYLNARATIETLIRLKVVPIVNENDTVATSEIRYGDNDRLSARVAVMGAAETLALLSDVDGLYTADPNRDAQARHLALVPEITPEITAMAGESASGLGSGGMVSKLVAAGMATRAGCTVLLCSGRRPHPLQALAEGARCTLFAARTSPARARKEWIAGSLSVAGSLAVDAGAVAALRRGSSLLPAGVRAVEGTFERGDALLVRGADGTPVAKGLSAYDAADAVRIAGRRTDEIEAILGFRGRDVMIHRDDLVLL